MQQVIHYDEGYEHVKDALYDLLDKNINDRNNYIYNFEGIADGHADKKHVIHSSSQDIDLIKDMIENDKDNNATFENEQSARDAIFDALTYPPSMKKIYNWMSKDRSEFDNKFQYDHLKITVNIGEDIGAGFDKNFREKVTEDVTVMLTRNRNSELGFGLDTAYPDIRTSHSRETGYQINIDSFKSGNFNKIEPMGRLYILAKTLQNNELLKYERGNELIRMKVEHKLTIYIEKDRTNIKVNTEKGHKQIELESIKELYPETYEKILTLNHLKEEIFKNEVTKENNKKIIKEELERDR